MIRKPFALAAVITALVSLPVAGRQAPPAQPPAQAPGAPAPPPAGQQPAGQPALAAGQVAPQGQQPTFRLAIDLVRTDVIVRDSRDQFVADLKPGEFEIYEDGVKQDIVSMNVIHGGRTYSTLTLAPPAPQEGMILPPPRPTNDAAGRIFILFVDDLHMQFGNTGRIKQLFKKIKDDLIHEGDLFGVVSTGPSSLSIDLTYDRRRLDEAIGRISGAGLKPNEILSAPETSEGPSEVRYRAHTAFRTAWDLMKNLEQVRDRRKALIWVSDGYDFNPFPDSRAKARQELMPGNRSGNNDGTIDDNSQSDAADLWDKSGQQFADADLVRELADLTRTANRANVTMYTLDPRGLVGMPDLDEKVDMTEWQDYVRKSQDSLRVLAHETGGIAVVNQNDFDKALKRIDAETSDYYVLGYYSNNPDPLKKNRRIEVKVLRSDLNVWSRKGYTLRPRPKVEVPK
ncbi:MAG: VWFA-related Acidobacterial domain protein [Acidobacteria bacterium]|nr:VWFA-related Acidobacterial domain protein [Acidobacteriota bacterium]